MESRTIFFGMEMSQAENMPLVLNRFLSKYKPQTIIEIGTFKGGLSALFQSYSLSFNKTFVTYDIKDHISNQDLHNSLKTNKKISDVFNLETQNEIKHLIQQEGVTVIFCDGGNKIKEFNIFSKYLKKGDFILAHDYSKTIEFFNEKIKNKVWDWCEITDLDIQDACIENSLEKVFEEFDYVATTCRVKIC